MEAVNKNPSEIVPVPSLPVYTPASLLSILSNAFILQEEKKIIQVKGIFLKTGTVSYKPGVYYNKLKEEATDKSLSIITPILIHNELKNNTTISVNGFLTRKIENSGSIQFQLNILELVNTTINKYSDEDLKRIEIVNAKVNSGFRDLDSLIKHLIYDNKKIKIGIISPRTLVAEGDIRKEMSSSVVHYIMTYSKVSFASPKEISDEIIKFDNSDVDFICVTRGGGEGMEPFSKPELIGTLLNRKKIVVSAIGHDVDIPLFEQVADRKFATPTAFGSYLNRIYNETVEELSKSKAKMQKDITDQLKAIYDEQIKTLNGKLDTTTKLYANEKKSILESHETLKRQIIELQERKLKDANDNAQRLKAENDRLASQIAELRKSSSPNYVAIVIIIIIILVFLMIVNKR